jgi:hypothetical protein
LTAGNQLYRISGEVRETQFTAFFMCSDIVWQTSCSTIISDIGKDVRRNTMDIRKIFAAVIFTAGTTVLCAGCGTDPVTLVKNSALQYDGSITIGQAVSGMENKKRAEWSAWQDKQGRQYVTVKITAQDPERMFFGSNYFSSRACSENELGDAFDSAVYNLFDIMTGYGLPNVYGVDSDILRTAADNYSQYINTVSPEMRARYFMLKSCTLVLNFLITRTDSGELSCIDGSLILPVTVLEKENIIPLTIPLDADTGLAMVYDNLSLGDTYNR